MRAKCALAAAFEVDPDLLRRMAAAATVAALNKHSVKCLITNLFVRHTHSHTNTSDRELKDLCHRNKEVIVIWMRQKCTDDEGVINFYFIFLLNLFAAVNELISAKIAFC